MSDLDLKERLYGPPQWGYMCLADGGFIKDDAPVEAADRIAALEDALRPFAERKTIEESLRGEGDDEWLGASVDRRIELMGERKRKNDADILHAHRLLTQGDA